MCFVVGFGWLSSCLCFFFGGGGGVGVGLGSGLLIRCAVCSLCVLSLCGFGCFQLWFRGGDLVLVASVPSRCFLRFTLRVSTLF